MFCYCNINTTWDWDLRVEYSALQNFRLGGGGGDDNLDIGRKEGRKKRKCEMTNDFLKQIIITHSQLNVLKLDFEICDE